MLHLIQVYAPTSTHSDTVYDAFLDDVSTLVARRGQRFSQTIIMGDFNAKIGMQQRNECALGRFGFGVCNERGKRLADFCNNNRLFVLNTLFHKSPQRKWTWRSPNGTTKNEIDYIISNDRRNVADVSVLSSFNTGSDHRLIRATFNVIRRLRPRPSKPRYQNEVYFNRDFYKIASSAQLTMATPPNDEATDIYRHIVTNESLYRSSQQNNSSDAVDETSDVENDNAPPFLESKIRQALQKMKSCTSPGYDGITAEALSAGAESLAPILTHLFNNCLDHASIPEGFADAKSILLYTKGNATDIKNYRPISLLNTTYKVFTRVIGNRINSILDAAETAEQAGFQQSFSTIDHIHAVNELIEKTTNYK
uniref:Endonuclease/exonuclease/phosphatase domain-containing protein n=1 Tax=Plectus sambesii TaxID=2011161 RepID=A0A914WVW6_9BILA